MEILSFAQNDGGGEGKAVVWLFVDQFGVGVGDFGG